MRKGDSDDKPSIVKPRILAFYHRVFIKLLGRRKAIIVPQTASIFRQNPTFASKTVKLIYSKAFQTILLLFTCISAQYLNEEIEPDLKSRLVKALKAAGEAAIESSLDSHYVNLIRAISKGWSSSE